MTDAGQALAAATRLLAAAGIASARADAEILLGHELGASRGAVQALALTGRPVEADVLARFARAVERRADREPLQHLTGRAPFRTLELQVGPGVFVPRPETEVVAQAAIDAASGMDAPFVVDLASGSGAIALSVAAEVPGADVVGVERNPAALAWARRNADALGLPNAAIVEGDLADALPGIDGTVDVVVSNPPYIPEGMIPRDPEVRLHDPADALYGGPDGLDPMRALVRTAARLLKPGGLLVVEHGELQGAAVRALLPPREWRDASTHPDLTARDRYTTATRRWPSGGEGAAGGSAPGTIAGMATVVDCADPVSLLPGMREARAAISRGDLVVMPTDTVYGIAADAFQPMAVRRLLLAKGRGPDAPPPVLVPTRETLDALAEIVPEAVTRLVERFWPGALTIILPARSTLAWDLGETHGTVALRMPDDRIALELLAETGPLAVSSANLTGQPPATTAADALTQLGDVIDVYLDNGATPGPVPSTIVDATGLTDGTGPLRIVRLGMIPEEDLKAVAPEAFEAFATADEIPEP